MTLTGKSGGDQPYIMVDIPIRKGSPAQKEFKAIKDIRKAHPKLDIVRWEGGKQDDSGALSEVTKMTVAGPADDVYEFSKKCK